MNLLLTAFLWGSAFLGRCQELRALRLSLCHQVARTITHPHCRNEHFESGLSSNARERFDSAAEARAIGKVRRNDTAIAAARALKSENCISDAQRSQRLSLCLYTVPAVFLYKIPPSVTWDSKTARPKPELLAKSKGTTRELQRHER